mmetsp:Transcript_29344/g.66411  ORF Transcript_29344/g.66411 Transcript_29344/m.66411 type:complete len:119 (-) Transcript_29344:135-491(-)
MGEFDQPAERLRNQGDCRCSSSPTNRAADRRQYYVNATHEVATEFPHVRVLRVWEETRVRHNLHVVGACTLAPQHRNSEAISGTIGRKCCDCTHWCYTPEFYDLLYFDALSRLLSFER